MPHHLVSFMPLHPGRFMRPRSTGLRRFGGMLSRPETLGAMTEQGTMTGTMTAMTVVVTVGVMAGATVVVAMWVEATGMAGVADGAGLAALTVALCVGLMWINFGGSLG